MRFAKLILLVAILLTGCSRHHLSKGDRAYSQMAYASAVKDYERVLSVSPDHDVAVRVARACSHLNSPEKAATFFAIAEKASPLTNTEQLEFGSVLQQIGKPTEAAQRVSHVVVLEPDNRKAIALLAACNADAAFYVDSAYRIVRPIQLDGVVSAFGATPYSNGFVFAGERSADRKSKNPLNGRSFLDLYYAEQNTDGSFLPAAPLIGEVNGKYHEGPATFNGEQNIMLFTRSDYVERRLTTDENSVSHLQLFRAEKDAEGAWSKIHQFAYNSDGQSTGQAALSADGNTLYVVSDAKGGYGGTDIYKCRWMRNMWSPPENLGSVINTAGNESFPTLWGDTLFFSSNGHSGMGGLDIFRSVPEGDEWSVPKNMNYPINSMRDDLGLALTGDGHTGYLSSDRSGRDAIYSLTMLQPEQEHEPVLVMTGTIRHKLSNGTLDSATVTLTDAESKISISQKTTSDGNYSFELERDRNYQISVSKDGMFSIALQVNTIDQHLDRNYFENVYLEKVNFNEAILIPNIHYDIDSWELRPDAANELDKVARVFKNNPQLSFELGSHTDSRASTKYNMLLSEARAKSAVDYLVRSGVDPHRIIARGYGESALLNGCTDGIRCSEEEHQANRRTEFKVVALASAH